MWTFIIGVVIGLALGYLPNLVKTPNTDTEHLTKRCIRDAIAQERINQQTQRDLLIKQHAEKIEQLMQQMQRDSDERVCILRKKHNAQLDACEVSFASLKIRDKIMMEKLIQNEMDIINQSHFQKRIDISDHQACEQRLSLLKAQLVTCEEDKTYVDDQLNEQKRKSAELQQTIDELLEKKCEKCAKPCEKCFVYKKREIEKQRELEKFLKDKRENDNVIFQEGLQQVQKVAEVKIQELRDKYAKQIQQIMSLTPRFLPDPDDNDATDNTNFKAAQWAWKLTEKIPNRVRTFPNIVYLLHFKARLADGRAISGYKIGESGEGLIQRICSLNSEYNADKKINVIAVLGGRDRRFEKKTLKRFKEFLQDVSTERKNKREFFREREEIVKYYHKYFMIAPDISYFNPDYLMFVR